jgi:transcriptional regulator with XRE-family HTH domain
MNKNLKLLRQRQALSLTDLANLSKVGRVTINRIENGKQIPRPRTVRALAKALHIEVEELTAEQSKLF